MAYRPDKSEYKIRKKILKKMGYDSYKDYIVSLDWLLRKNQIINFYNKKKWQIGCELCVTTNNLQIHHNTYKHMDKNVTDIRYIGGYSFLCGSCHTKIHYDDKLLEYFERAQTPEEMEEWRLIFKKYDEKLETLSTNN
jgi:hypothetical protein